MPHTCHTVCCPITLAPITDPVIDACGHTFERSAIEAWLKKGNFTCPVSGAALEHTKLVTNYAIVDDDSEVQKLRKRIKTCYHDTYLLIMTIIDSGVVGCGTLFLTRYNCKFVAQKILEEYDAVECCFLELRKVLRWHKTLEQSQTNMMENLKLCAVAYSDYVDTVKRGACPAISMEVFKFEVARTASMFLTRSSICPPHTVKTTWVPCIGKQIVKALSSKTHPIRMGFRVGEFGLEYGS